MNKWSLLLFTFGLITKCNAWVYPEHRGIAIIAMQQLTWEEYRSLGMLWSEARKGYENRLTESIIDSSLGHNHLELDYASFFAIAGDHSCSPANLLFNILHTQWVLSVADIAEKLRIDLQHAKTQTQSQNAVSESDNRLQRTDVEYVSRAGSNSAHFMLARSEAGTTIERYLMACAEKGAPLNAFGIYAFFHSSALLKAAKYASQKLSAEEKSSLILSALADEAFAQHFLEDGFAAGHIAGTRGKTSIRKGTHDYYNEKGLEVVTWNGHRMVIMGDAYMRDEDAQVAAAAVKLSLQQFIHIATGSNLFEINILPDGEKDVADNFSICENKVNPAFAIETKYLAEILAQMPVPGLASGFGELPRFRSEIGKFFGASTSLDGMMIFSGFGKNQMQNGLIPGLEADVRFGFGLDGVLNQSGDGLIFMQVGWRLDGSSSSQYSDDIRSAPSNNITSAIPSRSAFTARIRLPFYIIPGDLIILAPILLLSSQNSLTKIAAIAANGGLIPWQTAISTKIGRFQFILGREVGISFYGYSSPKTILVIPDSNGNIDVIQYKSTKFEFPVLEYRPFRTFSLDQTSSLIMQFSAGFDIPFSYGKTGNNQPAPELKTVWQVGLRILFNWRHYY